MCEPETLWSLLTDRNHWIMEIIIMMLFDGIGGLIVWPFFRKWLLHHEGDDRKILRLEQQVKELQDQMKVRNGQ
jgi:hypothetical protein